MISLFVTNIYLSIM